MLGDHIKRQQEGKQRLGKEIEEAGALLQSNEQRGLFEVKRIGNHIEIDKTDPFFLIRHIRDALRGLVNTNIDIDMEAGLRLVTSNSSPLLDLACFQIQC
jgi:hypothetical protein